MLRAQSQSTSSAWGWRKLGRVREFEPESLSSPTGYVSSDPQACATQTSYLNIYSSGSLCLPPTPNARADDTHSTWARFKFSVRNLLLSINRLYEIRKQRRYSNNNVTISLGLLAIVDVSVFTKSRHTCSSTDLVTSHLNITNPSKYWTLYFTILSVWNWSLHIHNLWWWRLMKYNKINFRCRVTSLYP